MQTCQPVYIPNTITPYSCLQFLMDELMLPLMCFHLFPIIIEKVKRDNHLFVQNGLYFSVSHSHVLSKTVQHQHLPLHSQDQHTTNITK